MGYTKESGLHVETKLRFHEESTWETEYAMFNHYRGSNNYHLRQYIINMQI